MMLAASAALVLGAVGTYSRVPQTYFHEARHAYRSAGYAGGRGSVVRRYSREDPSGVDAMYDWNRYMDFADSHGWRRQ